MEIGEVVRRGYGVRSRNAAPAAGTGVALNVVGSFARHRHLAALARPVLHGNRRAPSPRLDCV